MIWSKSAQLIFSSLYGSFSKDLKLFYCLMHALITAYGFRSVIVSFDAVLMEQYQAAFLKLRTKI